MKETVSNLNVAMDPIYRLIFKTLPKLSCSLKFDTKKKFTLPFLNYKPLNLQLRVFLAGDTVATLSRKR